MPLDRRQLSEEKVPDSLRNQSAFDSLAQDIRRLQVEYARFLGGERDQPPQALRDELAARIANLRSAPKQATADRFRLSTLAAQLTSYNELFDRRVRNQQARVLAERKPIEAVVAGSERGSNAVRRLYSELFKNAEGHNTSMEGFREFLDTKVTEIRKRTGCSSVQFRVIETDGRRSLKAKPVGRNAKTVTFKPQRSQETP